MSIWGILMRIAVLILATIIFVVGCLYEYPPRRDIISDRNAPQSPSSGAVIQREAEKAADIIPGVIDANYKIKPFSRYNKVQVEQLQIGLKNKRFYYGEIDGIYGPKTKAALQRFRNYNRLTVTGEPSAAEIAMIFK